jgi:hypothetical protein
MISFSRYFYESNEDFSQKENVKILGVGNYRAKVDSGNDGYCVLHGDNISINNNEVSFDTIDGKNIKKPIIDTIKVNVGAGTHEDRPVVEFDIQIKNETHKNVKFSIGNRKENDEKVLIGLKFLKPIKAVIEIK